MKMAENETLHLLLVRHSHENAVKWNFGVRIIGKKEGNGQARTSRPVELIAAPDNELLTKSDSCPKKQLSLLRRVPNLYKANALLPFSAASWIEDGTLAKKSKPVRRSMASIVVTNVESSL